MIHPFFDPAQTTAFNALARKTDSTFEPKFKLTTAFGVMPIPTETSADGKTKLQIAESDAIERYVARKFGLFGDGGVFEEVLMESFASNTQALINQIFDVYDYSDPAVKAANKGPLTDHHIARWIKHHEKHLQANGVNGHYVADKFTLADVKTDYVITIIQAMTGEALISQENTPAIWKVRQEMDKIESVAVWKASEEYTSIGKDNFDLLGY
ncbi:MAG: hypothetical protein J3R72DRAFT_422434 [Linnemannia gamsii]|nr:MAG: hypothetical protein J3R72DRAFT_422434 [Linnemannia gamsii]